MDLEIDIPNLLARAKNFANHMYGPDDPRRENCEREFFHREYMRMITPPRQSFEERVIELLTQIRDRKPNERY